MKTNAIFLLLVSVVLVSGCIEQPVQVCGGDTNNCVAGSGQDNSKGNTNNDPMMTDGIPGSAENTDTGTMTEPQTRTIEMTDAGYEPKSLVIKAGDTVTFINKGTGQNWPASAMHPTHTVYPGSGIDKCGSGENIFDACGDIEPEESWSFTFSEKGEWKYHNHLNPSQFGSIIVE